jgi:hypothetical protein
MACCACGEPAEMIDGKFNHARFDVPDLEDAHGMRAAHICKSCCTWAVVAWSIKAKLERVEPPAPPTPTGPPTATGEAPELKAQAA